MEADFPEENPESSFCVTGRDALKHALFIYNGMSNIYPLIF